MADSTKNSYEIDLGRDFRRNQIPARVSFLSEASSGRLGPRSDPAYLAPSRQAVRLPLDSANLANLNKFGTHRLLTLALARHRILPIDRFGLQCWTYTRPACKKGWIMRVRAKVTTNHARFAIRTLLGFWLLCLLPFAASAQSTISGVVKDASGAVVANATVEASSDVLIEKTRTVTTNSDGRYAIVDLRPGTYVVSVSLAGFNTVKQTVVVPSNVTVPVDAEMKVGTVGEVVNVEARVATVDVENVAHPETLTRSDMDSLPTGRYMQSIASYVPGAHLNLPDIGGSQQIEQNYISVHGNLSKEDVYMYDGMLINTTYLDGQIQQYVDNATIQETTYQASNNTLDASGGGMFTNIIPKDGGNQFHANFFGGGSGGSNFWQGNNLSNVTALRGLTAQDKTVKIEDFNGSFGGPIKT